MAIAGRVAIVPKGDWSAETEYKRLDEVTYNNTMFIAKKAVPKGTLPTNAEYWSKSIVGGVGAIATTEEAGIVKPDGKSMSVDESGTLSINLDGTTITLDEAKNVIKLADTLKDKIGSALQPESIVNNQITTVEGFALDARQANPNLDGTLAKQVADLNGSLNLCVKQFTIPVNESIAIPCLNCIIFYNGSNARTFSIATTIGYASDTIRSRISYINGDESNGLKLSYSEEGTRDAWLGIFKIENTNTINVARIAVIGIKNFSLM
jgi:hypothetical protein